MRRWPIMHCSNAMLNKTPEPVDSLHTWTLTVAVPGVDLFYPQCSWCDRPQELPGCFICCTSLRLNHWRVLWALNMHYSHVQCVFHPTDLFVQTFYIFCLLKCSYIITAVEIRQDLHLNTNSDPHFPPHTWFIFISANIVFYLKNKTSVDKLQTGKVEKFFINVEVLTLKLLSSQVT